jgi:hypothetical protein
MKLIGLDEFDWSKWDQPKSNKPADIVDALRAACRATVREQVYLSSTRILRVVGNESKRTYYPVVLAVLPFLKTMLIDGNMHVREIVMEVLVDLAGEFRVDPGFEEWKTSGGARLGAAVAEALKGFRPQARAFLSADTATTRVRDLAEAFERLLAKQREV